jgi:N-methylhydantoinase A
MSYRLGFDIGGTFTDFALYDDSTGNVLIGKSLTTPADPSVGALKGMAAFLNEQHTSLDKVQYAVHATTVAANALIERKGSITALVTTRGFRDVLEIGRSKRHSLYDLQVERPEVLVPRRLRFEVSERISATGEVVSPLQEDEFRQTIRAFPDLGVEAVAICFLHSYRNAAHELRAAEIVREELGDALSVALSHDVSGRIREYERSSTAAANAYVAPIVDRYLEALEAGMARAGYGQHLYVMQSNGGIASSASARRYPVRIVESGPAAGALVASLYGQAAGYGDLVCFDMGGTTAKLCLFENGHPRFTHMFEVDMKLMAPDSGLPLNIEAIDLVEIGAGGGSIARTVHGTLQVGPESAGADPGPMCYARGGKEPTVTDADIVLGYLNPSYFLGGKMQLDARAAEAGILEHVAEPLGLSLIEGAWGIHRVVNASMEGAARQVTIERGRDPREASMVAFGGAGPVHAVALAQSLGMQRVLVPLGAGVTSAIGLLSAKPKFDLATSYVTELTVESIDAINQIFGRMMDEATRLLEDAGATSPFEFRRTAHMRYEGQGYDIEVPLPEGVMTPLAIEVLRATFDKVYATSYGYAEADARVWASDWYLTATGFWPGLDLSSEKVEERSEPEAPTSYRRVYFSETDWVERCPVYDRYNLVAGAFGEGPAIIEERESTTVVPPGCRWRIDPYRTLIVELVGGRDG